MFRFLFNFKSLHAKPSFRFTTFHIIRQHLNFNTLHSSTIQENFLKTLPQISNPEFITYLNHFANNLDQSSPLWEKIFLKLQFTLDQFSFPELAQVSQTLGEAKQFDKSFWQLMETKFLENLYVDEDSYHILSEFLHGLANSIHTVSPSFLLRLLEFLDTAKDIKGNDLAALVHSLAILKMKHPENPKLQSTFERLFSKAFKEIKYLDFEGLANLANALVKTPRRMTEEERNTILQHMELVDNTITSNGINLLSSAFWDIEFFDGKLGGMIMSNVIKASEEVNGKQLVDACFIILKSELTDEGILAGLKKRILESIPIVDGRDSIKAGFCLNRLNIRDENLWKKIRNDVLEVADKINKHEVKWIYQGFAETIKGDKVFWEKIDSVFKSNKFEMDSKSVEEIEKLKPQFQ